MPGAGGGIALPSIASGFGSDGRAAALGAGGGALLGDAGDPGSVTGSGARGADVWGIRPC